METTILPARSTAALALAVELLRQGQVVALPTDTLYGLAANAFDRWAVRRVYEVKERPFANPLPIFIARVDDLNQVCRVVPDEARPLLQRYWPGALTVVLPRAARLPAEVTAGGPTVAIRIPAHPTPLDLLNRLNIPLTATSANLSGGPSPTTAQEVEHQLGGRIPLILDGGPCPSAVPSTIIDFSVKPARLVRAGAIPAKDLQEFLLSTE